MRFLNGLAFAGCLLLSACGGGGDESIEPASPPAGDSQAPTVQLAASTASVTAAGTLLLTATTSDNIGVSAIEFYDGATRLPSNGNTASIALTEAHNGSHRYTAVARDAAGNSATSAAASVSVAIPVPPASQRQLKKSFLSLDGTQTVWYWEYLPPGYSSSTKTWPLLVFFHGVGESGAADGSQLDRVKVHGPPKLINANHDMCFETPDGRECFIVVSPQNGRGRWDGNDTAGMLAHAMRTYRADPKRIYVTGLSMGGGATWNLASATEAGVNPARYWAGKIAAAAPICGASDSRNFHGGICNGVVGRSLPVWAFHGDADGTVSLATSQGWVNKINKASTADGYNCSTAANPAAKLTVYPGVGHDSWTRTYDPAREVEPGKNLYQWLLSHQRS
jgi:poly(3-hydroxybutyrate) depolymerase